MNFLLFVAASFADGISKFEGLEELKFKESDRLKFDDNSSSKFRCNH